MDTECYQYDLRRSNSFIEVGPGNVLQGLIKKVNRDVVTEGASIR